MTLDDRSLREHLDRRADGGATDSAGLADAVMARLAAVPRGPWWRRLGSLSPGLGLAAAAVVVALVAVAVLPSRLGPAPGTSPSPSTVAVLAGYPSNRALTDEELVSLVEDAATLVGTVVVADVELAPIGIYCPTIDCPGHAIRVTGRSVVISVYVEGTSGPILNGPYALRVRGTNAVELVASVRPAAGGLAWTLPAYVDQLPDLGAADRLTSQAYLVAATAYRLAMPPSCPTTIGASPPTIDFGCGLAIWLVPADWDEPAGGLDQAPVDGLRLQNEADPGWGAGFRPVPGFFLVRPIEADSCFLCPSGGASEFVAAVPEVSLADRSAFASPAPTTGAATAPTVTDIAFSTESVSLDGFETADVNVTATFAGDVIQYLQTDGALTPLICLQRDGAADPLDPHATVVPRTLVQVEGTKWVASFRMTSGDRGTWRVTCVVAYDGDGHDLNANPSLTGDSPTLEVVGTHPPHLTMEFKPSPVEVGQAFEVFGRVTDEDTGDPYAGVIVTIGRDTACTEGGNGETVTTDAEGRYTYVIPQADASAVCTWITDLDGVFPGLITDPVAIYATLSAHPTEP